MPLGEITRTLLMSQASASLAPAESEIALYRYRHGVYRGSGDAADRMEAKDSLLSPKQRLL